MKLAKRVFLTVQQNCQDESKLGDLSLHIQVEDPTANPLFHDFTTSPIFSLQGEGNTLPRIENSSLRITFFIVPQLYPVFHDLLSIVDDRNSLWFSLGLANLVIIEREAQNVAATVRKHLEKIDNCIGWETWNIKSQKFVSKEHHLTSKITDEIPSCNLELPKGLPLYLEFCISEYISSANRLLAAASRFTPHYVINYKQTISAANLLINDLCFLSGLRQYHPSDSIVAVLMAQNVEDAYANLSNTKFRKQKEELLNIKHSMIVQLNSSLSYLLTQAYSGTFPLLHNNGVVNRHSLLGIAGGVGALYELMIQLERAFYNIPVEDLQSSKYSTLSSIPPTFLDIFNEVSTFDVEKWKVDTASADILKMKGHFKKPEDEKGFYHRFACFSGRLGFREHEFAATAAIQVLVEGNTLKWNIINYTHEIIHNHVRIILKQLLLPVEDLTVESYETWLSQYRDLFKTIFHGVLPTEKITYKDYFTLVLINFCLFSDYYGSLNRPSNYEAITDLRTSQRSSPFQLLTLHELKEVAQHTYRDITEIFVHVIDFIYVYKRKQTSYLLSIWLSWSTLPSVTINLRQYVLRSLVVIGIGETGNQKQRFEKALVKFRGVLNVIREKLQDELIVESVLKVLSDENEKKDLLYRFYNCILVGDLVAQFFVADIADHLDNQDENRLSVDATDEDGNAISYGISTGSFKGKMIKSKIRFLLDQLEREVAKIGYRGDNETQERNSAWLLLSLSTTII